MIGLRCLWGLEGCVSRVSIIIDEKVIFSERTSGLGRRRFIVENVFSKRKRWKCIEINF